MTAIETRLDQKYEWIEPQDFEEAKTRRAAAINEKLDIETQLADRDKRHPDGTRMNDVEYHEWRQRAMWAKRFREKEITMLKEWLRKAQERGFKPQRLIVPDDDDVRLMHALYRIARYVNGERVPWDRYSEDEQNTLKAAQLRLRAFGVTDDESGI